VEAGADRGSVPPGEDRFQHARSDPIRFNAGGL
jgi:hypothetical protein